MLYKKRYISAQSNLAIHYTVRCVCPLLSPTSIKRTHARTHAHTHTCTWTSMHTHTYHTHSYTHARAHTHNLTTPVFPPSLPVSLHPPPPVITSEPVKTAAPHKKRSGVNQRRLVKCPTSWDLSTCSCITASFDSVKGIILC